jgi:hypothetical protein
MVIYIICFFMSFFFFLKHMYDMYVCICMCICILIRFRTRGEDGEALGVDREGHASLAHCVVVFWGR